MFRAAAGRQNDPPQRGQGLFQEGIVDISAIVAAIERAPIRYVERRTTGKTEGQVRRREEQLPEREGVRAAARDHPRRAAAVVISVDDRRAVPQITHSTDVESGPDSAKHLRVAVAVGTRSRGASADEPNPLRVAKRTWL